MPDCVTLLRHSKSVIWMDQTECCRVHTYVQGNNHDSNLTKQGLGAASFETSLKWKNTYFIIIKHTQTPIVISMQRFAIPSQPKKRWRCELLVYYYFFTPGILFTIATRTLLVSDTTWSTLGSQLTRNKGQTRVKQGSNKGQTKVKQTKTMKINMESKSSWRTCFSSLDEIEYCIR